jgi:integrase
MNELGRQVHPKRLIQTRDGVVLSMSSDYWHFSANGSRYIFDFRGIKPNSSSIFFESAKLVVAHFLQIYAPSTAHNYLYHICIFCEYMLNVQRAPIKEFTPEDILSYHSSLPQRRRYYVGVLSAALKTWHRLGIHGVSASVRQTLDEIAPGGNPTGEAVLTHNPQKGPLSDIELEGLVAALGRSFENGKIDLESFVLVWVLLATGRRNIQLAALKLKDFRIAVAPDGTRFYWLDVPRAKQKGLPIRAETKSFKLSPQIGELVELLISQRRKQDASEFGGEAPLFQGAGGGPGLENHMNVSELGRRLKAIVTSLRVMSPRTGDALHVTPRRLRYSIGTRAAAEGANEFEIAELLDHSTSETARIYVKASPQMLERVDRAIAEQLAPFAQAFAGVLVTGEADAKRGQDPTSRILDPVVSDDPVGTCGSFSFCSLWAPIACYTCIHFQPWLDGPHELVLDDLLAKRQASIERNGDIRIASINDRTILAMTRVVQLCRDMKDANAVEERP